MELTIRIYFEEISYSGSRTIKLNQNELDDMLSEYLVREDYLKTTEQLKDITYEDIKL